MGWILREKNLTYDGKDGMLRNELWNEVDDMMPSLMQQAQNRNMIKVDSRTSKTSYFERETIKNFWKCKRIINRNCLPSHSIQRRRAPADTQYQYYNNNHAQ